MQPLASTQCEVRSDRLTRQLYATDASIYQIEPVAVAFPRDGVEASAVIRAAVQAGLPVIPRGAGTGLVGGALGRGLIVEFARHNNRITGLDLDARTVRVGPGVVLDQLNTFLKPHGLCFGPDVATSSRATLGGMIANNSSGSHVPIYGTTADHVSSVELVLADGRIETVGPRHPALPKERALLRELLARHTAELGDRCPPGLLKRWPGYGLDRCRTDPDDLTQLIAGSEGTLAAITSAVLRVVPLPRQKGLGLIFFASVAEAMRATVELLDLNPAAIEHVDRVLFDQTRGQLAFRAARGLLQLDTHPCESILLVEFYDDAVADRLHSLAARKLGLRSTLLTSAAEMNLVWNLRKAGLSLLTGCKGAAKPATGIEDVAVRPEQLPDYVTALQAMLRKLDLHACFYGHAATGLLHVRPVLDLHNAGDLRKFRQLAQDVSDLVRQFKGSLAAEHGVGIARTEFLEDHLGPQLMDAMRRIKAAFDPLDSFNPGKLFDRDAWKFDGSLRWGARIPLPFKPALAFAAKDRSFTANLEQCNGCGGCRKLAPTMCPTFLVTGEEIMSTRGRANAIRAALETDADPLRSAALDAALSNCLSCKACTLECPSNVNLALLKAELLNARHRRYGVSLRERLLGAVDQLGRLGCLTPELANHLLDSAVLRAAMQRWIGLSARRPLMPYATERFDRWFNKPRIQHHRNAHRGPVYLWDDTFVRYHEPRIGQAAVKVLEALGFDVRLVQGRRCCGRPAFSQGLLDQAREQGEHNLALLSEESTTEAPILFLEPSCFSMFVEDYRELRLRQAQAIAQRAFLFEDFVNRVLAREPEAIRFPSASERIAIHAHCHAKSLVNPEFMPALARRLPGREAGLLETGCCGMAGAFGALADKYDLSVRVAKPLVERLLSQPPGTVIVASGTSCRHQIEHLTPYKPLHMAEWLARSLG